MAKLKVKKGDNVLVLNGKDNGKIAEVLECFPSESKVTVKGINMIVKHKKPKSAQDKGGIIKLEGKIDVSDVMVVCPVCNKATRVKMGVDANGKKVRICKKCGAVLDTGAKKVSKTTKSSKTSENKTVEVKEEKVSAKKTTSKTTSKTENKDTQKHETKSTVKASKSNTVKKSASTAKKIGGK